MMKNPIQHYARWRILYTMYWKVDALWTGNSRFRRLNTWLNDCMDNVGLRMGFLLPSLMAATEQEG